MDQTHNEIVAANSYVNWACYSRKKDGVQVSFLFLRVESHSYSAQKRDKMGLEN